MGPAMRACCRTKSAESFRRRAHEQPQTGRTGEIMKILFVLVAFLICLPSAKAYTNGPGANTYTTDGTAGDVDAAIKAAADGWTVIVPSGSFNWTSGVSISGKAVHLKGQGAGRVIGRSTSSVEI